MPETSYQCDLLLITVNEHEVREVLAAAKKRGYEEKIVCIGKKSYSNLGVIGGIRVTMVQSEKGSGTPGGSLQTMMWAREDLKPKAVIAVGIAFGARKGKQRLADILISEQIFQYEPQRIGSEDIRFRGDRVTPHDTGLIDRFRVAQRSWKKTGVHFGLILSGEKLVDNKEYLAGLLGGVSEAIGGEMEASGIHSAAGGTPWLVVKAISDWADGSKNNKNKERHQRKAAEMAAEFVLLTLEQGGFPSLFEQAPRPGNDSVEKLEINANSSRIAETFSSYDLGSFLESFRVFLPNGPLMFQTAYEQGSLAERSKASEVVQHLLEDGSALIIGPPESGKTILAVQAIELLRKTSPEIGPGAWYIYAKPSQSDDIIKFLNSKADSPLILLIDDAQIDEASSWTLYNEWDAIRASGRKTYLVFTSQYYEVDTEELRSHNFFHLFTRDTRSIPSYDELTAYLQSSWRKFIQEPLPPATLSGLRRLAKGSFAMANIAVSVARSRPLDYATDLRRLQRSIITSVLAKYEVNGQAPETRRALTLAAFGIPINIEAFGKGPAEILLEKEFIVAIPDRPGYAVSPIKPVAELWERLHSRLPQSAEELSQYIRAPGSNYYDVLIKLQNSRNLKLLSTILNNEFGLLRERISSEQDLLRIARVLSAIATVSHRLARLVLETVVSEVDLLERLYKSDNPKAILRFVSTGTFLSSRFLSKVPNQDAIAEILEKKFLNSREELSAVAELCNAAARSSIKLAQRLVSSAIQARALGTQGTEDRPVTTSDLVAFAGRISWFSRKNSLPLSAFLDAKSLSDLLRSSTNPRTARRDIHSIAMLSHRKVIASLKDLMNRREIDDWLAQLISPPVNLFSLAELLDEINRLGKRLGARFIDRALPYLREAVRRDSRLPALGYLLAIVRRANHKAAENLLLEISMNNRLENEFLQEDSPLRFGLTLTNIARVDKRRASELVRAIGDQQWEYLINDARSLSNIAILFRSIAECVNAPDELVSRLAGQAGSLISFRRLAEESTALDLAHFASIVSITCPLSWQTKTEVLKWVSPERFSNLLRNSKDTREAGILLRSFSVAYPREAESFALSISESTLPKLWCESSDLTSIAFLLQAATDVDGRLADALGNEVPRHGVLNLLELEPKATRVADFLFALSKVFSPHARDLTRKVYSRRSCLDVIEGCGNLRDVVVLLNAVRASDREFFEEWLRGSLRVKQIRMEEEILPRAKEESNLGVLAALISSFLSVKEGVPFAQRIVNELDKDWIKQIAWLDNGIVQSLQFVTRLAHLGLKGWFQDLRSLVLTRLAPRIEEIRGLRALTFCLVEMFRASSALKADDLPAKFVHHIPFGDLKTTMSYSDDVVGIASLCSLLSSLKQNEFSFDLANHARQAVLNKVAAHRPFHALLAMALTRISPTQLGNHELAEQLRDPKSLALWEAGFLNWIWAQHADRVVRHGSSQPFLQIPELMNSLSQGRSRKQLLSELAERTGGNHRFVFLLAAARLDGTANLISEHAQVREQWESRSWIRRLFTEFSGPAGGSFERQSPETVALCIRELAPQAEAVKLVEGVEQFEPDEVLALF